jgi:hypothetical protein
MAGMFSGPQNEESLRSKNVNCDTAIATSRILRAASSQ